MSAPRRFPLAPALLAVLVLLGAPAGVAHGAVPLPLGGPGLPEARSVRDVAPGVRVLRIVRGVPSPRDVWTVDVAFVPTRAAARALAAELTTAGRPDVRTRRISERAQDDPATGPLGYVVRCMCQPSIRRSSTAPWCPSSARRSCRATSC